MDQEYESKIEKLHIFCSQMEEKHNHMLETEQKIQKLKIEQSEQEAKLSQLVQKLEEEGRQDAHFEREKKLEEYNQLIELLERQIVSEKSEQGQRLSQLQADIQNNIRSLSIIEMKMKGYKPPSVERPIQQPYPPNTEYENFLSELRTTFQNKQMKLRQLKLQNKRSSKTLSPTRQPAQRRSNSLLEAQIRQTGLKFKAYAAHAESIRVKKEHEQEQQLAALNHEISQLQSQSNPPTQILSYFSQHERTEHLTQLRQSFDALKTEYTKLSVDNEKDKSRMLQIYEEIRNIEQSRLDSNSQQSRLPEYEIQIAHLNQKISYANQEIAEVNQENSNVQQEIKNACLRKEQLETSFADCLKAKEAEEQVEVVQTEVNKVQQLIKKQEDLQKSLIPQEEIDKIKESIEKAKEVMKEQPALQAENEQLQKEIKNKSNEEAEHPPIIDRLLEERTKVDLKTEEMLKLTEQCEQMKSKIREWQQCYSLQDDQSLQEMFSESFFQEPKKNGKWAQILLYLFILVNFWLLVPRLLS